MREGAKVLLLVLLVLLILIAMGLLVLEQGLAYGQDAALVAATWSVVILVFIVGGVCCWAFGGDE